MKKSFLWFILFAFVLLLEAFSEASSNKQLSVFYSKTALFNKDTTAFPTSFGFGRVATEKEITALDIDVRPDGQGLPKGEGIVRKGKMIYDIKCVACHGIGGIGGPNGSLVTSDTPSVKRRERTIGNYWAYSTTVFDYIRRAMPFNQPGSLSNEEVYHLTAYLLSANKIIDSTAVINAQTLPKIVMPAQKLFVPDDRKGGAEIR